MRIPVPLILIVLAAACRSEAGDVKDSSSRTTDAAEPTTLTLLAMGNERDLRPSVNRPPMHLLYLPLFSRNRDGELEGRLVRSWEKSADGLTWTYHLRTDVLWHDGVPFSARDVEYSIDLKRQRQYETPSARQVEVVDDSTLRITYGASNRSPLDSWFVYLPSHLVGHLTAEELWESDYWDHPIGNGPYRYVRHIPETMVELEANPDFVFGRPKIDRLILKLRGGPTWMELERGDVDVAGWAMVGGAEAARLARNPEFRTYWKHAPGIKMIFYNHRHPVLRDARVRRAFTHAIDRETIAHVSFTPEEARLFDVPLSERQLLEGDVPKPAPYDPGVARRLLEEAGWTDTDGDGVRERNASELRLSLLAEDEQSAVLIQESLRQVGVAIDIETLAPPVHMERLRAGEYELATETETARTLFRYLLGDPPRPDSPSGYANPELLRLFESFSGMVDPAAQDSLLREMWPIFQEEIPVTFVHPQIWYGAAHKRVKGLSSPHRVWVEMHTEEFWIEEEE